MKRINNTLLLFRIGMPVIIGACMITGVKSQTITAEQLVPPATNSSMIIGFNNTPITGPIGTGSYIIGHQNSVVGTYLTVVGYNNLVNGAQSATVFGKGNSVSNGYTSSAIGYENNISSPTSVAFGRENIVSGSGSGVAFGYANHATNYEALSFGLKNVASNYQACAFGMRNKALGAYSNAFGTRNNLNADYSGAYGYHNTINAVNAYTFGQYITNNVPNSVMIGASKEANTTILANGNVGINTSNPTQRLDVSGGSFSVASTQNQFTLANVDNSSVTPMGSSDMMGLFAGDVMLRSFWGVSVDLNNGALGDNPNATYTRLPQTSSFTINSRSSATTFNTLFTVRNSGNVGIGVTNPVAKVEIMNNASQTAAAAIRAMSPDNHFVTINSSIVTQGYNNIVQAGDAGIVYSNGSSGTGAFVITPWANATSGLRMDNNGSVGIGTGNTADANYKLFVETGIRTRKVKVDQASWPDYVFDSSYTPQPLAQVAQYINNNKHLPGVPSAEEVKKEGLDLGNNQAVLLKKIEELTLYAIQQETTAKQQAEKINQQDATIKSLEERMQRLEELVKAATATKNP